MQRQTILIYTPTLTARLRYVVEWVFTQQLNVDFDITTNISAYENSTGLARLNYSDNPIVAEELHILPHYLLFKNTIEKTILEEVDNLQRDPLAFIFFCLSRYEEYIAPPSVRDTHGRFLAKASWSFKAGFLQQPVVNQAVIHLKKQLEARFPLLKCTLPVFQFQPTFDIDMAWRYRHKGFLRTAGGILKDVKNGDFIEIKNKHQILRGGRNDPDFTFEQIFDWHRDLAVQPIFFWLLADYSRFDKNTDWRNRAFQSIIQKTADKFVVGIHPSYRSNSETHRILIEKKRLESITQRNITKSRQHFLKLQLPETYRQLIAAGITDDYSMGFSDDIGFRAGTCTPFKWYDLAAEQATNLTIHPFQVMDVTLKEYLKLQPQEALARVESLISNIEAVGGSFTTLWHNPSVGDSPEWREWRDMYRQLIARFF